MPRLKPASPRKLIRWIAAAAAVAGVFLFASDAARHAGSADAQQVPALKRADDLFEKKNYKDAAEAYEAYLKTAKPDEAAWHASTQAILARLRLNLFDDVERIGADSIKRFAGRVEEARAERLLGNLFLTFPHYGTIQGGKYLRSQHTQGRYVQTNLKDRNTAVTHLEKARELYAAAVEKAVKDNADKKVIEELKAERMECLFDLAAAASRFGPYDLGWWGSYNELDEENPDEVGENDGARGFRGRGYYGRRPPQGIPVDLEGKPLFDPIPAAYDAKLPLGQKMKFALQEITRLDHTDEKAYAGRAVYRRAMLARARYGTERLRNYGWYDDGSGNLNDQLAKKNIWELKDNEVLTMLGSRLATVTLPADEDVIAVLDLVVKEYPKCGIADEARYARALYFQTRKQYDRCLAEYDVLAKEHPQSKLLGAAQSNRSVILAGEANIQQTGLQLAGDFAKLPAVHRNIKSIEFTARELDLAKCIDDLKKELEANPQNWRWHLSNLSYALLHDNMYQKYLGKEVAKWTSEVADDGTKRYRTTELTTPLKDRGCFFVHGRHAGGGEVRAVVLLTDLAIVEKKVRDKTLFWTVDARTGQPVQSKLEFFEFSQVYDQKTRKSNWVTKRTPDKTNDAGIVEFAPAVDANRGGVQLVTVADAGNGRWAFTGVNWWNNYWRSSVSYDGFRAFMTTDRPVYRPGHTINFRLWARAIRNGEYVEPGKQRVQVIVNDARGQKVYDRTEQTDDEGGLAGSFELSPSAALGMYHTYFHVVGANTQPAGGQFRVEEYKKPEFEVTVDTGKSRAKLGEKIEAVIRAKYYFGAPVTEASVKYKVFRTPYSHMYTAPGEWDWLYGVGYGRTWYAYDWFPGWGRWGTRCCVWYPWWGAPPKPERELVQEGESRIGHDGTVKLMLDTAIALKNHPDSDHQYSIEAEVVDESRRTITGGGTVTATRQEFYAYVEQDRGYYNPGDLGRFKVRTLTADNSPRSVTGKVTVARIVYGAGAAQITEEPIQTFDVKTDDDGKAEFSVRFEKSGQFKVGFETKDAWNATVAGAAVSWVAGAGFDGSVYRFTDLEIISDKRSYKVGEIAKLMINAKHAGSVVMFSDDVDNGVLRSYRLIHLPKKSVIIDVPVTKAHQPNFFIEALTVRDGRIHQEAKEIAVPPEQGMVKVAIRPDKAEYLPGATGRIEVTTTTPEGKPISAQVSLAAYDKSVLYIQSDLTPDIRQFFWGQRRHHYIQTQHSLAYVFHWNRNLNDPQYWHAHIPESWHGSWGARWRNFAAMEGDELKRLGEGRGAGYATREAQAATGAAAPNAPGAERAAKAADSSDRDGKQQDGLRRNRGEAEKDKNGEPGNAGEPPLAEAAVRSKFADTALWAPMVTTDENGKAVVTINFPENLTAWKIKAYGMTKGTRVGADEAQVVTNKNVLVRLQAPRFFIERDEVVISANVHNYLKAAKKARVAIAIQKEYMQLMTEAVVEVTVPAGGEKRVDWVVKVLNEGKARIEVKAQTDEESDAMALTLPVLVHGMDKMVAAVGSIRPAGPGTRTVELIVPEERKPAATKLEVRFSPSLAGAMIDALPYLVSYPYGCVEQTMSRFLPTVVTAKTLQNMGVKLEDIKKQAVNLNAQEIGKVRADRFRGRHCDNPVFDTAELNRMIQAGLDRIYDFQQGNGGWGWWKHDTANAYLTAYVLYGLVTATECDVQVRPDVINRGYNALAQSMNEAVREVKEWKEEMKKAEPERRNFYRWSEYRLSYQYNSMAFSAFVQAMKKQKNDEALAMVFAERDRLSLYGKSMLCLAYHKLGDAAKAKLLMENILQYKQEDKENETVWFRTPNENWWYWYNNDVETNAYILKALSALDPKGEDGPRLVKWLLNNRRHGTYWRSTRDTAITVQAMGDYIKATGESRPDYTLIVHLDGKPVKNVRITRENFFSFDNALTIEGEALTGGKHTLTVTREGEGAVYYSAYLSYFTKEADIKAAGLELKVDRKYYRLDRIEGEGAVEGARGQPLVEKRLRWKKTLLKDGDVLNSGDLVQVELKLTSKNEYEYLCFEDFKPAGCEPVDVKSGHRFGELCSNMELRDERVVFFLGWLGQGDHLINYRVRAEIPGTFHALPTKGFAMYNPELRCNSDEMRIRIKDKK